MKKIVICTRIDQECLKSLAKLANHTFSEECQVHLVHCLKNEAYSYDFFTSYYPTHDQIDGLKSSVLEILNQEKEKYLANKNIKEFKTVVLHSGSPESSLKEYLSDQKADLVVTSTRQRGSIENIFHSSFSNYLNSNSPCDVYVMRE